MLRKIYTDRDGRRNAQLDVIVWDNEMQQIKVLKKTGKLFQFVDKEDDSILWFCVQDGTRHWTIYDVMSGYQCCWTTSLKKAKEMMTDPEFVRKVNQAREVRDKIQRSRYEDWNDMTAHFNAQLDTLQEKYL